MKKKKKNMKFEKEKKNLRALIKIKQYEKSNNNSFSSNFMNLKKLKLNKIDKKDKNGMKNNNSSINISIIEKNKRKTCYDFGYNSVINNDMKFKKSNTLNINILFIY